MISVSFFSLKKHNWSLVFKLQRDVAILKTKTERHSAAPLVAVHQASYFHRLRLGQAKDMWLTPNNIHIHTERNRRGHRITKITNTYKKKHNIASNAPAPNLRKQLLFRTRQNPFSKISQFPKNAVNDPPKTLVFSEKKITCLHNTVDF